MFDACSDPAISGGAESALSVHVPLKKQARGTRGLPWTTRVIAHGFIAWWFSIRSILSVQELYREIHLTPRACATQNEVEIYPWYRNISFIGSPA